MSPCNETVFEKFLMIFSRDYFDFVNIYVIVKKKTLLTFHRIETMNLL